MSTPARVMQLMRRSRIDSLQDSLAVEIDAGRVRQTIYDGGSDEGDSQCGHFFGDGVYARSLLIPAGTCVIGKIHKQARVVIVAQGKCRFIDEFHAQTVQAPWIGEFKPGTKTAVYALTDTMWVACLGTDSKDSKTAFSDLVVGTHEEYVEFVQKAEEAKCLSEQ